MPVLDGFQLHNSGTATLLVREWSPQQNRNVSVGHTGNWEAPVGGKMEIASPMILTYGHWIVQACFWSGCVLSGLIILSPAGNGNPEYQHALNATDKVEGSLAVRVLLLS